jgi:hypothetical protein
VVRCMSAAPGCHRRGTIGCSIESRHIIAAVFRISQRRCVMARWTRGHCASVPSLAFSMTVTERFALYRSAGAGSSASSLAALAASNDAPLAQKRDHYDGARLAQASEC